MSTSYIRYPLSGVPIYSSPSALPATAVAGSLATTISNDSLYIYDTNTGWNLIGTPGSGSGTVTSVAMTVPSILTIVGSPITTAGTLAVDLATQTQRTFFSGPAGGTATQPTFRTIQTTDLPATVGTVQSVALADSTGIFNISGSPVTTSGTLTLASLQSQAANSFLAAPSTGAGAPTFRGIAVSDVPTLNQNTTGTAGNITATSNTSLTSLANLATVGTITSGTWNGSTISVTHGGTGQTSFSDGALFISSGAFASGTLSIADGGTGHTTASTAFNALSPMTTAGDLIYGGAGGAGTRLAAGSQYQVLTMGATNPGWGAVALNQAGSVSGVLPAANGGTGGSSFANNALLQGNGTGISVTAGLFYSNASSGPGIGTYLQAIDPISGTFGFIVGQANNIAPLALGAGDCMLVGYDNTNMVFATDGTFRGAWLKGGGLQIGSSGPTLSNSGTSLTVSGAIQLGSALAVAYGGTGTTTSTGTGSTVLSASPTFTGTVNAAAITASGTIQSGIFQSSTASPATAGIVRLANNDHIDWANATSGNAFLTLDASNNFSFSGAFNAMQFNGADLLGAGSVQHTGGVAVQGTNTNNSAAAGYIGEYVSSASSSYSNFPASTNYGDATSISLTAGDWDITAQLMLKLNSSVMQASFIAISTTAGNSGAGISDGDNELGIALPTSTDFTAGTIAGYRASISGTTTYYLKVYAQYSAGTPQYVYRISARRIR